MNALEAELERAAPPGFIAAPNDRFRTGRRNRRRRSAGMSFCSNDYLGLANHPEIRQVFAEAIENTASAAAPRT